MCGYSEVYTYMCVFVKNFISISVCVCVCILSDARLYVCVPIAIGVVTCMCVYL